MKELFFKEVITGIQNKRYDYEINRCPRIFEEDEKYELNVIAENNKYSVKLKSSEVEMFKFLLANYVCEDVWMSTEESLKSIKEFR